MGFVSKDKEVFMKFVANVGISMYVDVIFMSFSYVFIRSP